MPNLPANFFCEKRSSSQTSKFEKKILMNIKCLHRNQHVIL
jgi:hypothetical protein